MGYYLLIFKRMMKDKECIDSSFENVKNQ